MRLIFLCFLVLCFSQCNFFDENIDNPMFISFNDVSLLTTGDQGANTHNIKDIWVYFDEQLQGVFELPITLPVVSENPTVNITVFAGIRNNGVFNDPIQYPFYQRDEHMVGFTPNKTIDIDLEFRYSENLVFDFVENFEDPHIFGFDVDQNNETFISIDASTAASGTGSGKFEFSPINPNIEVTSSFKISTNGLQGGLLYLEMDYKNDYEFQVGIFTTEGAFEFKTYKVLVAQSDEWNKIYIDLSSEISNSAISEYRLLIGTSLINEDEANIFIDNLKLLHF